MKKRFLSFGLVLSMAVGMLAGCGSSTKNTSWKVTCPWAPSGVAAMVSQKAASKSTEYSDSITLVADAIKGDAATVNTWVADTKANDAELVFVGEGLLSITEILDPAKMQFSYDDFEFVENLYSSVFVLSADATLNLNSLDELEAYAKDADEISVAVNGATGSEAFLAAALFGSMDAGDRLKLVAYTSADEAAQAVSKGETDFAVSHQSQILETWQQGGVTVVCAFDENAIENGPFAGVEGVGQHGYPYFRNRCFIMARAGTDESKIADLKELYDKILADDEVAEWLQDTMLLEVDTMSKEDVEAHIDNVKSIVNEYKDIVAG
jgi:tripartite-type tricarboxylate transporter receptor subunit TctC